MACNRSRRRYLPGRAVVNIIINLLGGDHVGMPRRVHSKLDYSIFGWLRGTMSQ